MSLLRSALPRASALRATTRPHTALRSLSTTPVVRGGGASHEDHYDPPGGWLWGQRPGEKAEKEGWESIFTYGFFGAMGFLLVGYCYKPDTRYV